MSYKKGCSNVRNAGRHNLNIFIIKTDIKNYFPSVSENKVKNFFKYKLQTSSSVAKTLSSLLCRDGCLVKGSPVSGFIAFWSNVDMFDEIYSICNSSNATFTLYVDDLTISTPNENIDLLRRVNGIIRKYGYIPHKCVKAKSNEEKVITGVVLGKNKYRSKKSTYRKQSLRNKKQTISGAKRYADYVDTLNS